MNKVKRSIAKKYLDILMEEKDPEIYRSLASAASVIALTMIMQWLDKRGITHCRHCPETGQLFNSLGHYFCKTHLVNGSKPLEVVGGNHAS